MERQHKLALRKGNSTVFVRMDAVNEETLNEVSNTREQFINRSCNG